MEKQTNAVVNPTPATAVVLSRNQVELADTNLVENDHWNRGSGDGDGIIVGI